MAQLFFQTEINSDKSATTDKSLSNGFSKKPNTSQYVKIGFPQLHTNDLRKEVPFQKNKTLSFEPKLHLGV